MDPLLPEASGVNAFQLAVRHPPATTSALSLSDAVKRQSSGGGGGRSVPAWQNGAGGSSGFGGSSNSSGGSGGGSSMWALRKRAPTAGSAVEGRGWNDAGKKTKRLHGVGEGDAHGMLLREEGCTYVLNVFFKANFLAWGALYHRPKRLAFEKYCTLNPTSNPMP